MPAAVKQRRTDRRVQVTVPASLLSELRKRYGTKGLVVESERASTNFRNTEWFKEISGELTPAEALRTYRKNRGFTLAQLAKLLGPTIRIQNVSNMENGSRGISKDMARKLAEIFKTSPARFI